MSWLRSFWQSLFRSESDELVKNFSPRAQQVLALARQEANRFNHNFIGTEHLLLGVVALGQGTAVAALNRMGLSLEAVRREVEQQVGQGPEEIMSGPIPYTPRVKKALALAAKESMALNHSYVGTEHILLGLLREGDGADGRVLKELGVNVETARQNILKELDPNYSPPPENKAMFQKPKSSQREPIDTSRRYDVYCRDAEKEIVYRNALFKGIKTLFKEREFDVFSEYMELELADGQTIFISRASIFKFREHGKGEAHA